MQRKVVRRSIAQLSVARRLLPLEGDRDVRFFVPPGERGGDLCDRLELLDPHLEPLRRPPFPPLPLRRWEERSLSLLFDRPREPSRLTPPASAGSRRGSPRRESVPAAWRPISIQYQHLILQDLPLMPRPAV